MQVQELASNQSNLSISTWTAFESELDVICVSYFSLEGKSQDLNECHDVQCATS